MRRLVVLAALLAAAACESSNSVSPSVSIAGQYNLMTVNGASLPYTFTTTNGASATLTSDMLTMNTDGSYSDIAQFQSSQGPYTINEVGTYSTVNGSITFYDQTDGIQYNGSLSGSVLTEINSGVTEVYQKQ